MARAIEDIRADLDALRSARASGARRIVTHTGGVRKEVEFKTDAEMRDAILGLERELAGFSGRPIHTVRIGTSKGFSS